MHFHHCTKMPIHQILIKFHYKSIDHGKLEFCTLVKHGKLVFKVYQHGKTPMNIICGCFTILVNLNTGFPCFTSVQNSSIP